MARRLVLIGEHTADATWREHDGLDHQSHRNVVPLGVCNLI
jgi:hypothetical protein